MTKMHFRLLMSQVVMKMDKGLERMATLKTEQVWAKVDHNCRKSIHLREVALTTTTQTKGIQTMLTMESNKHTFNQSWAAKSMEDLRLKLQTRKLLQQSAILNKMNLTVKQMWLATQIQMSTRYSCSQSTKGISHLKVLWQSLINHLSCLSRKAT